MIYKTTLICILIIFSSYSTRYYVDNAAANDAGSGSVASPKKYFPSGISLMSAGDTLIIQNGTYSGTSNNLSALPTGTSGSRCVIMAASDGGVIITSTFYEVSGANSYTDIYGLKLKSAVSKSTNRANTRFFRCAFEGGQQCSSNCNGATNWECGSYQLYEDCWFYGVGGRYTVMLWEVHDVVLRRCVIRHDGGYSANEDNPEAPIANYGAANISYQNVICIDNTLTYSGDYTSSFYCTGHDYNPASNNVSFIGCIDLNGTSGSWYIDTDDHSTGMSFTDCVAWGNVDGFSMSNTGVALTFNRVMAGNMSSHSINRYAGTMTFTNSIFYNHSGTFGTFTNTYCNGYNPTGFSGTGSISINPTTNGLSYLTRIENGSALKTAGSSSGQIGPQIVYKIGMSGTMFGESGYNTTTAEALWPWPNEARIKSDFASIPSIGQRGFCTGNSLNGSAQSLTKYIWEALGNEHPDQSGRTLQWIGGSSADALNANNYNPAYSPTSIDTVILNTGSANITIGKLNVANFRQESGYTGTITINDTLTTSKLNIGTVTVHFYSPCIIRDSIVYGSTSNPVTHAGSKIVSVAGYPLVVRLNGRLSTPNVVMTPGAGSKIKWR